MLRQRVVTALVLVLFGGIVLLWMPPRFIGYVFAAILGLVAWEWVRFGGIHDLRWRAAAGLLAAIGLAFLADFLEQPEVLVLCGAAWAGWLATLAWFRHPEFCADPGLRARAVKLLVGAAVIVTAAVALGHLYRMPQGRAWFLLLLVLIAAADIGAYFSGRRFGRRKLAPRISPGKTWEGVIGGMAAVAIVAAVGGRLLGLSWPETLGLVLLAVVTAGTSILGDLLASLMKRQSGLKDSSNLLPGHGGVIDRFDSLMAAAPVFFLGVVSLNP